MAETAITPKDEAKAKISELVAAYEALTPAQAKAYHEAKTKQGFVQPLFRALGWDFDNVDEVSPEENASKGRVDYAFKIRGVSRFYLETKHLNADLANADHIKQAITYAYNKGVTRAGLTSFDRLRLFNAQTGQPFLNLTCQDYLDDFDRLWLLAKELVESGRLDSEAMKVGALPTPQPIERRLFNQLKVWREEIFTQLHHYNPSLSLSQIDAVIQRIFNRLIFIRICEDRHIEERALLAAVNQWKSDGHKPELIEKLKEVFRQFDEYYDSDLFAKHEADGIFVEAATLERIIDGLYEVPGGVASYDFSVIDADVLGAVYEQYLGHVTGVAKRRVREGQGRLDLGMDISLEAKKEKRKEQGIYYTPKWVTDYIVKHTVGRFLAERTHDEIMKIKIVDPACGSGSFLIRAYDELLQYHAAASRKSVADLDQWDRLPVLNRNIFGVDLDGQAVEIARLNLLLRSLARREILPSLADNVRRGNSLISGTPEELERYFGPSWAEKRPFDWQTALAPSVRAGEFDVVIGNPPYIRIQNLPREDANYYRDKYQSARGSFDIYIMFIERGLQLLKPGGRLGFITSGKFLTTDYGRQLRELVRKDATVEDVVDLSAQQVFSEATTYPVIIVLRKDHQDQPLHYASVQASSDTISPPSTPTPVDVQQEAIVAGVWPPRSNTQAPSLLARIRENTVRLLDLPSAMLRGTSTGADDVFCLVETGGGLRTRGGKPVDIEPGILRKPLYATDFSRFQFRPENRESIIFPYNVLSDRYEILSEEALRSEFPNAYTYLLSRRLELERRRQYNQWFGYSAPRNLHTHERSHLIVPLLADRGKVALMPEARHEFCVMASAGFTVALNKVNREASPMYVLGLVNSKLLFWYLRQISTGFAVGGSPVRNNTSAGFRFGALTPPTPPT